MTLDQSSPVRCCNYRADSDPDCNCYSDYLSNSHSHFDTLQNWWLVGAKSLRAIGK